MDIFDELKDQERQKQFDKYVTVITRRMERLRALYGRPEWRSGRAQIEYEGYAELLDTITKNYEAGKDLFWG